MPDVDALTIQVQGLSEGAAQSIQKLTQRLKDLEKSASGGAGLQAVKTKLSSIQAQVDKINSGKFGDLVKKVEALNKTKIDGTLTKSLGSIATASRHANSSIGNTAARLGIMGISLRVVVNSIASAMKQSMAYMENMNLFTVSMGKYADEAMKYANAVSEVMGIDPSAWARNQGVFMSLAEGFGVASDRAYKMSKNLTQLGYDLSSFYNISYEDAFQKLQSGISGELEPLRRLGIDLSEARLKAIAFELGITKVYSAMTQAEKAQLRYHAIMTQTTKAQGDMARTLEAPANQLRVLKAAASQAGRAIGNIFIPILNAVLPVAIAAANAVRIVASAFASLLGFAMPTVDYSGIDGAADAAGKLNENLGGAGGSAKELQKVLMGFDEINKIPDASGGGGGGGGGGALDGFDFELLEYDFLGDAVNTRVNEIMQKLAPALDFVKTHADDLLQIVKAVGIAFLEWKVASKLIPDLRTGRNIVNTIKNILLGLTLGAITIGLNFEFTQDFMQNSTDGNLDWGSLISNSLTATFGSGLTGLVIKQATGSSTAGWIATGATLTISMLTDLELQKRDVIAAGTWDEDNMLLAIKDALLGVAAGGAIGYSIGGVPGAGIGALAGLAISLVSTLVVMIDSIRISQTQKAIMQMKAGVHLAEQGINDFIKEQMNFDVDAQVSILNAQAELAQTAKDDLEASIQEFIGTMNLIKLGVDVEDSVSKALTQLTGQDGVLKRLQTSLEMDTNHLKATISFAPPVSDNGSSNYANELYTAYENASTSMYNVVEALGNTLADLLTESMSRNLTENEQSLVESITASIARIDQQVALQSIATDFYREIQGIDWNDLDTDSYIAAVNKVTKAYDTAKSAAEEEYRATIANIQGEIWAYEDLRKTALEAMDYHASLGEDGEVDKYISLIEEYDSAIAHLEEQIASFNLDATIEAFGDSLITKMVPSVQKAAKEIFPKIFTDSLEETEFNLGKFMSGQLFENQRHVSYETTSAIANLKSTFMKFFDWGDNASGGGGGSPIIAQAEEAGKQVADAFVGAIDDGMKQVDALGDESTFSGLRTQLVATGEDARGISEAIHEIPTNYAINLSIPSYSTIINRINNIATRVKSITSGSINIKVKAGVDSGSKQFLMQLAQVSPTSTLAGQLMELIELSAFAKGGFPKRGDLFIANESGPELVGRIGNKTAVANEDQIGDTILSYMEQAEGGGGGGSMDEERFASALVRAMKSAGLGALRIDGKDIIRSINRETQRTGHTPLTIK